MIDSSPVASRLLRLALVSALLTGMGAHLAVLQGCAWAAMTWRAVHGRTVSQALSETFDGKHPCPVCAAIKASSPAESLTAASVPPLDMIAHAPLIVPAPAPARPSLPERLLAASGFEPPPVSPPPERLPA